MAPAHPGPGSPAQLRRARPDEAEAITRLALRSKRRWGYSDAFMATLVPELSLAAGDIERDHVEVLDSDGRLLGFLRLQRRRDVAWLADLFIDPELVGHGLGRQLFERALELGREWGCGRMEFDSDPNAEPFYRHLGAERVGTMDSQLVQGRAYPLMRYEL